MNTCSPELLFENYLNQCYESIKEFGCNLIIESINCLQSINVECEMIDVIDAISLNSIFFIDVLKLDPIGCELPVSSINYIDQSKIDFRSCEYSPKLWASIQNFDVLNYLSMEDKYTVNYKLDVYKIIDLYSEKIQFYQLERYNSYCPQEKIRIRLQQHFAMRDGIFYSDDDFRETKKERKRLLESECPQKIDKEIIEISECLKFLDKDEETTCLNKKNFVRCINDYLENENNLKCPEEIINNLLLDNKEFLIFKSAGHLKTCWYNPIDPKIFQITDDSKCSDYYSEEILEQSGCLLILEYSQDGCKAWDRGLECFANFLLNIGKECPTEKLGEILIDTQDAYLQYKANEMLKKCRLYESDEVEEKEENCPNQFEEEIIDNSLCIDLIKEETNDCRYWDLFYECFGDYYNHKIGNCKKEDIKSILINNHIEYLRYHASRNLKICLKPSEYTECPEFLEERVISTSNCTSILQLQVSECQSLNPFVECLSEEIEKIDGYICSVEQLENIIIEYYIGLVRNLGSDSLKENCFDKNCTRFEMVQGYDKCANELYEKYSKDKSENCSNVAYEFYHCNKWQSIFCTNDQIVQYIEWEKSSQTNYNIEESCKSEEKCEEYIIYDKYNNFCRDSVLNAPSGKLCNDLFYTLLCMSTYFSSDQSCTLNSYYQFFNQIENLDLTNLDKPDQCKDVYCDDDSIIFIIMSGICGSIKPSEYSSTCEHQNAILNCTEKSLMAMDQNCSSGRTNSVLQQYNQEYQNTFGYTPQNC
ncbi:MAG: hypothetical protein MHPSP_001173 [Paramarteilia canceri]